MEEQENMKANIKTNFQFKDSNASEDMLGQIIEDGFDIETFFSVPGTMSKETHVIKSTKQIRKEIEEKENLKD